VAAAQGLKPPQGLGIGGGPLIPATDTVVSSVAPSKNLTVPVGSGAPPTVGHATINTPIDVFPVKGSA
jgi:hypothetical protein